jgi:hypothetical protein
VREPSENAQSGTLTRVGIRLLLRSPLIVGLALASWFKLAFTGWGFESSVGAQFVRDAPWLVLSAATGVAAVAVFCGAVGVAIRYSVVGALPAVLMASAFLTDLY